MKIIKYRLSHLGRRSSANQTRHPPPPLRKKALLIGVQNLRLDPDEITQEKHERATNDEPENVDAAPRRKKKKKQKDRDKEGTPKAGVLKGPHRDVLEMKQLLIDKYHYDPKDITVLIDNNNPDHIQPTKENMIQKMSELVDGALAGDRFFFHFSGHATQKDTDSPEEEDRKDEFIISSDGETIQDDATASGPSTDWKQPSDLKHYRCNRVYVPWLNKGRRKTDFPRNIMMRHNARIDVSLRSVTQARRLSRSAITWKRTSIDQVLASPVATSTGTFDFRSPIKTKSKKSLSISTDMGKEPWYGSTMSPIDRCGSPESMYCTGKCRENPLPEGRPSADVISLSSSKDSQRSWEDPQGSSMTQALIKVLKNDPNPSLKDLLTLISHDLHVFYVSMHGAARRYKMEVKAINDSRKQEGKEPKKATSVEMDNFQDPQISSPQPLDMNRRWHL